MYDWIDLLDKKLDLLVQAKAVHGVEMSSSAADLLGVIQNVASTFSAAWPQMRIVLCEARNACDDNPELDRLREALLPFFPEGALD